MIGHNRRQAAFADLLDHSAAQICEYDQIGIVVSNLSNGCLIKLPEEHRLVFQAASLQGCADYGRRGESIRVHMRNDDKIPPL